MFMLVVAVGAGEVDMKVFPSAEYCGACTGHRVFHLLVNLGWVDFDLGVLSSCLAASATFPLVEHLKSK